MPGRLTVSPLLFSPLCSNRLQLSTLPEAYSSPDDQDPQEMLTSGEVAICRLQTYHQTCIIYNIAQEKGPGYQLGQCTCECYASGWRARIDECLEATISLIHMIMNVTCECSAADDRDRFASRSCELFNFRSRFGSLFKLIISKNHGAFILLKLQRSGAIKLLTLTFYR